MSARVYFGYPPDKAANVALSTIKSFLAQSKFPKRVVLCAFSEEAAKPLQAALSQKHPSPRIDPLLAQVMFHYTSKTGKEGIEASGAIHVSTPFGNDARPDAILGEGVYVTDLDPRKHNKNVIKSQTQALYVDECVRLDLPDDRLRRSEDNHHVYVFPETVLASEQPGGRFQWMQCSD